MAKPKYKLYVDKMVAADEELFEKFGKLNDLFEEDHEKYQVEFNEVGEKVMRMVREYEARLCKGSEGGFNQFTSKLAEKFQNEVRSRFSMIDWVGVVEESDNSSKKNGFNLRRISLN